MATGIKTKITGGYCRAVQYGAYSDALLDKPIF